MGSPLLPVKLENENEINLKVVSQLNELDQYFRVKRDEPMQQLMIRWSVRADMQDYRTCRFLFDGKRVDEKKTPKELKMEDGDSIDVFTELIGG
ncbi:putative Ubiquitin-like domain-containing protein [Helianthus annuus]|nr:putative Ubiquitin-like domain-containing protein [Helianthus annuus]